jgi:hypothetical protein
MKKTYTFCELEPLIDRVSQLASMTMMAHVALLHGDYDIKDYVGGLWLLDDLLHDLKRDFTALVQSE